MPPELCVIFNPASGKSRGVRRLERLRAGWGAHAEFRPTARAGHAVELAQQAALEGFRVVAAAGGDGTVHEVVNGLMRAGRPEVHFALVPIGSANDYAYSLGLTRALPTAPAPVRVDVGRVRTPDGRQRYFACNVGFGFNGAVTLESRRIKRLQGLALYGLAALRALCRHFRHPVMAFQFDDEPAWQAPSLLFTALLGKREGGFELAPDAQLDDGLLDWLHGGALSRGEVLRLLPGLALSGPPNHHPKVRRGRCRRVRVASDEPLLIHTDGEFFCLPADGVTVVEIDLLPHALTVERAV